MHTSKEKRVLARGGKSALFGARAIHSQSTNSGSTNSTNRWPGQRMVLGVVVVVVVGGRTSGTVTSQRPGAPPSKGECKVKGEREKVRAPTVGSRTRQDRATSQKGEALARWAGWRRVRAVQSLAPSKSRRPSLFPLLPVPPSSHSLLLSCSSHHTNSPSQTLTNTQQNRFGEYLSSHTKAHSRGPAHCTSPQHTFYIFYFAHRSASLRIRQVCPCWIDLFFFLSSVAIASSSSSFKRSQPLLSP